MMATGMASMALVFVALAVPPDDLVIQEVMQRDAELAAAHGRGDMATYRAGLSSRYVYVDVGGKRVTADVLLQQRRDNDHRRVVSSETSEEEAIRLSGDVVLLRGLDRSMASYFGGLPRVSTTRWTALWVREHDGVWRLTADTATPVTTSNALAFVPVPQDEATLVKLAGRWTLQLPTPLELVLTAEAGKLVGTLPDVQARFVFAPSSSTHFFAEERPFELRFAPDGQALILVTWGTPTTATRTTQED